MSDNDFALSLWEEAHDVRALRSHVRGQDFVSDDDAGWRLAALEAHPSVRPCQCGSGIHWAHCPDPLQNHCCG